MFSSTEAQDHMTLLLLLFCSCNYYGLNPATDSRRVECCAHTETYWFKCSCAWAQQSQPTAEQNLNLGAQLAAWVCKCPPIFGMALALNSCKSIPTYLRCEYLMFKTPLYSLRRTNPYEMCWTDSQKTWTAAVHTPLALSCLHASGLEGSPAGGESADQPPDPSNSKPLCWEYITRWWFCYVNTCHWDH